jgi:hypothetical protein
MVQVKTAFQHEYQALGLVHDELAQQAHLFRAEVKSRWDALEIEWDGLGRHLGRAQLAAGDARHTIEASSEPLADSIRAGFIEIRRAFKH